MTLVLAEAEKNIKNAIELMNENKNILVKIVKIC
jgi:hypothetical protein